MCTERVLFSFRKMPGDAWQWRRVRKKTFYFWEPDSMKCTGNHFGKYSVITKFGALQKICYELLRFLLHEQLVVNTPNIPLSTSEVSRIRNEFEHKCLKICASEVKICQSHFERMLKSHAYAWWSSTKLNSAPSL